MTYKIKDKNKYLNIKNELGNTMEPDLKSH